MPEETKPQETPEPEQKQEPKQEVQESTPETPPTAEVKYIDIQSLSGKEHKVTSTEIYQLAQLGLQQIEEKDSPTEVKEESVPDTLEEKHEALNKQFQELKTERDNDRVLIQTKTILDREVVKYDLVTDYPELVDSIKISALATQQLNPRISLIEAVKLAVADRQKFMVSVQERDKQRALDTTKVSNAMSGVARGGGGLPNIDKDKKFTPEDVKSGATQKILQELLEGV